MSYYKYAERTSDRRVDWGAISKKMVDTLADAEKKRQEKLDAAAKREDDFELKLQEAPSGSDTTANDTVSRFAQDAMEYSLMLKRLWQSGQMSYSDYMAATSNMLNSTQAYFNQATNYQQNYEKHMERQQADENGFVPGSGVELDELARVEDFGNFSEYYPQFDYTTGQIYLRDSEGNRYAGVTELGVAVGQTYDRIPINALVEQQIEMVGVRDIVTDESDRTISIESALQPGPDGSQSPYLEAEDGMMGVILGYNDNSTTSLLRDYSPAGFNTGHLSDARTLELASQPGSKMVVMMPHPDDPTNTKYIGAVEQDVTDDQFSEYIISMGVEEGSEQYDNLINNRQSQKKAAQDFVRALIRTGLDLKETPRERTEVKPPSIEELKYMDELAKEDDLAVHWLNLLVGDEEAQKVAEQALKSRTGITGIENNADHVILRYDDTSSRTFPKLKQGEDRVTQDGVVYAPRFDLLQWGNMGLDVHGLSSDRLSGAAARAGLIEMTEGGARAAVADPTVEPGAMPDIVADVVNFQTGEIPVQTQKDRKDGKSVLPAGSIINLPPVAALDELLTSAEDEANRAAATEAAVESVLIGMFEPAGGVDVSQIETYSWDKVSTDKPDFARQLKTGENPVIRIKVAGMEQPLFLPLDNEQSTIYIKDLIRTLGELGQNQLTGKQLKNWIANIANEEYRDDVTYINRVLSADREYTLRRRGANTEPARTSVPQPPGI